MLAAGMSVLLLLVVGSPAVTMSALMLILFPFWTVSIFMRVTISAFIFQFLVSILIIFFSVFSVFSTVLVFGGVVRLFRFLCDQS